MQLLKTLRTMSFLGGISKNIATGVRGQASRSSDALISRFIPKSAVAKQAGCQIRVRRQFFGDIASLRRGNEADAGSTPQDANLGTVAEVKENC